MSHRIDRRTLLRLSAMAGAGALATPLLSTSASAAPLARTPRPALAGGRGAADRAADRIVRSVRRPWFPDRFFPVTAFGAVGDGTTDCSTSFRNAIAACHSRGGGHRSGVGRTYSIEHCAR